MSKMTPPLKSFLVVINKKWARILNRIHRWTQKALNLLKIRPTDLDTFLDCQTIFIRFSVYSFQIIMAATQNIQNLCGAQKWCMLKTFLGNRTLSGINSARLMFHFQNLFSKSSNAYYCRKICLFK